MKLAILKKIIELQGPLRVLVQKWEESGGWIRPYTLHLTEEHRAAFVKRFMEDQRKLLGPSEYSRPFGTPYWAPVLDLTDDVAEKLLASKDGIWGQTNQYPGNGGE